MRAKVRSIQSAASANATIEALKRRIEGINRDFVGRESALYQARRTLVTPLEAKLRRLQQRHLDVPALLADHGRWLEEFRELRRVRAALGGWEQKDVEDLTTLFLHREKMCEILNALGELHDVLGFHGVDTWAGELEFMRTGEMMDFEG